MDARGDKKVDGTQVFMYKCHGKENQRWASTDAGGGKVELVGTGGLCLDVKNASGKKDAKPVELWKCHHGANQQFNIQPDGHIKEVASGKCLMASAEKNGAAIVLDDCGSAKSELWTLVN
jgi:hypothetical protein